MIGMRMQVALYATAYKHNTALCDLQARKNTTIQGKRVAVSGSGNVAQFAVEKLLQMGAVPLTMSDSSGTLYEGNGFSIEQLAQVMTIKRNKGRLSEFKLSSTGVLAVPPVDVLLRFPGRMWPFITLHKSNANAMELSKCHCVCSMTHMGPLMRP